MVDPAATGGIPETLSTPLPGQPAADTPEIPPQIFAAAQTQAPSQPFTPMPPTSVSGKHAGGRRGTPLGWKIALGIVMLMSVVLVSYMYLTRPIQINGRPVLPLTNNQYVLSDKVMYLLRRPAVGDIITFQPTVSGMEYVGVITDVAESGGNRTYTVYSGPDKPWTVAEGKVISHIYYPYSHIDPAGLGGSSPTEALPTSTPSPSPEPTPALIPTESKKISTPTVTPKPAAIIPTSTPAPTNRPTSTPQPTSTPTPTPIPPDTQAPSVSIQGGPENNSTVNFTNVCFPLYVTDNRSSYPNLWVQTQFDGGSWSDWTTSMAPCYYNLSAGHHTFYVKAKDQAGNVTDEIGRGFTVDFGSTPATTP